MINNQDYATASVHWINAFYADDGHKVAKWILPAGHYIVAKRHRAERDTIVDAMLGLSAPSDKAANRLAERKRKVKLNGGIALITGQGNQSQTYQKEKR